MNKHPICNVSKFKQLFRVRISSEKSIRKKEIKNVAHNGWAMKKFFGPRSSKMAYKWGWFDLFNLIKNIRFRLYCLFNANSRYTKMHVYS